MPDRKRRSELPWVIKYRPKRVDDVVDQDQAKRVLVPWLREWAAGRPPSKRAALLYGPPGVGKTSLVEAAASELGFELVELNASDYRRAEDIRRIVGSAASKRPLWGRGIIILLDEIDGISAREDAGGLAALLEIIPRTANPIVMTANDPWKEQLRPLRDACLMVEFKRLTSGQIIGILQRICELEGLFCEKDALKYIADRSEGDLRAAINDLEAVAGGYGKVTLGIVKEVVRGRDKSMELWKALSEVFYARYSWQAKRAITNSEEDYESMMAWINDNIPRKYSNVEDYFRAYDALARASLFLSRARYIDWSMLSYVFDLMGPGVAFARKHPHAKQRYSYPERIKLLARMRSVREVRERVAEKLASRLLTSRATVKNEVIPILTIIFREAPSPVEAARLALGYSLSEDEVRFLAGPRSQEVLKAIERIRKSRASGAGAEEVEARRERPRGQLTLFGEPAGQRRSRASRRRKAGGRRGQRTLF